MFSVLGHNMQLYSEQCKCKGSDLINLNVSFTFIDDVSDDNIDPERHN